MNTAPDAIDTTEKRQKSIYFMLDFESKYKEFCRMVSDDHFASYEKDPAEASTDKHGPYVTQELIIPLIEFRKYMKTEYGIDYIRLKDVLEGIKRDNGWIARRMKVGE